MFITIIFINTLMHQKFILASSSKSRYKILKNAGLNFTQKKPNCNEEDIKKKINRKILNFGSYFYQVKTNFTIVRGLAYYDGFCVETNLNFKAKNNK